MEEEEEIKEEVKGKKVTKTPIEKWVVDPKQEARSKMVAGPKSIQIGGRLVFHTVPVQEGQGFMIIDPYTDL